MFLFDTRLELFCILLNMMWNLTSEYPFSVPFETASEFSGFHSHDNPIGSRVIEDLIHS